MRKITIAGNITKDAAIRQAGNDQVAGFSVAVNYKVKDEKHVMFFDCSLFGKRATALGPHLTKGSSVTVVGDFGTREYEGKTYMTIRVDDVALQGGKRETNGDGAKYGTSGAGASAKHTWTPDPMDAGGGLGNDDVPFITCKPNALGL